MTRFLLALLAGTTLAACNSTAPNNSGGGDTRYRYPEARVGSSKTVRFASTDGRFVGLSDGSLWNIDWSNAGAASSFKAGQPVEVRKVGGSSFPYQLSTPGSRPVRARYGKKLD